MLVPWIFKMHHPDYRGFFTKHPGFDSESFDSAWEVLSPNFWGSNDFLIGPIVQGYVPTLRESMALLYLWGCGWRYERTFFAIPTSAPSP